jgi:putative NADH-flavin reductase
VRITVFGANGRVGSKVVAEAVKRGHTVRAFVYSTSEHIVPHENIEIMQGDACDAADAAKAVVGAEVVINCLGSWGTKTKDIQTRAMQVIIPGMESAGVKRIISLTGAEARALSDKVTVVGRISHRLFGLFAGKILADGEDHLRQLEKSTLDWTVVRSPAMTDKGQGVSYAFTVKRPTLIATIRRDSVVQSLLDLTELNNQVRNAPFLKRR